MLAVHRNGSFDLADWITEDMYPNSYKIDETTPEGAIIFQKLNEYAPYLTLVTEDGILIDVIARSATPEEEAAANAPLPKTDEQLLIEQLLSQTAAQQAAIDSLVMDALGGVSSV